MAELPPNLRRGLDLFHKIESDCTCANCAYNLKGLSTGDRCPECGTPAGASFNGVNGRHRTFESDQPCAGCGYNLKGRAIGDHCPECGKPAGMAIPHEQWLSHAPISFLKPFSKGAMITGVMVPIHCVAFTLLIFFSRSTTTAVLASITGCVYAIGVTLLTVPRPAADGSANVREWAALRMLSRLSQWGWLGGTIAIAADAAITARVPGAPAGTVFSLMGVLMFVMAIAGLVPLLIYLVRIAQWAGDSEFADRLRMLPLLLPVSAAVAATGGIVGPMLSGGVVTFLLMPLAGVSVLFLIFGGFTSLRTCWNLASMGFWVIRNRDENLASSRRRSTRIVERVENARSKPQASRKQDQGPIDLV